MSFNADRHMAQRGIRYETLIPGNPQHEALAAEILTQAIPESIGEAYDHLVHLAEQAHGADGPIDECLHCWAYGKPGGNYRFAPYKGRRGFMASNAEEDDPLFLGMRRVAMFDVPRRLFAQQHGIWFYWLFNNVFVMSPTRAVDPDWAFQRHAYRQHWGITGKQPAGVPTPQDAFGYVREHLLNTHAAGLIRIREGLATEQDELGIDNVEVHGPLFTPVTAWMGSLTGGEILRQELNLPARLHTYNCCGAAAPAKPEQEASAVKQLQNQSPNKRDC